MHPQGTLKLADRKLVPGSTVTKGGEKSAGGGQLEIVLVGLAGRFRLGDVTPDSVGEFTQSFAIPADLDVGAYRLVAIATDEDEVASLNVELLAAPLDADKEHGHAEGASPSEGGEHAESAEPKPLALESRGKPVGDRRWQSSWPSWRVVCYFASLRKPLDQGIGDSQKMKTILSGIASATLLTPIMTPIAHAQTSDEHAHAPLNAQRHAHTPRSCASPEDRMPVRGDRVGLTGSPTIPFAE